MITDPRSSLTEKKSSPNESSFQAETPLIKSVGTAHRQSPAIPRKVVASYHRNTKIRMRSDEREKQIKITPLKSYLNLIITPISQVRQCPHSVN